MTAPAEMPLTVQFAKDHSRVLHILEDNLIEQYLGAAVQHAEQYMNRSLMPTAWRLSLPSFPVFVPLPKAPLKSVESVEYWDGSLWAPLAASEYYVFADSEPGSIYFTGTMPEVNTSIPYPVRINYTSGYATAADVPKPIKQAILLLADHFYNNRSQEIENRQMTSLELGAESLLHPYKVY